MLSFNNYWRKVPYLKLYYLVNTRHWDLQSAIDKLENVKLANGEKRKIMDNDGKVVMAMFMVLHEFWMNRRVLCILSRACFSV